MLYKVYDKVAIHNACIEVFINKKQVLLLLSSNFDFIFTLPSGIA
ncbi:MAG: hypothetical protein RJA25_495 [Bacteroidota bacterium]